MVAEPTAPDFTAIKQRQQQMWAAGDFSVIGTSIYPTAEVLCEEAGLLAGERVLDVACGSGNVSLAAARRGTHVIGIDFVPQSLERARERAHAERLAIEFQEADAEALPFPEGTFDVVLSGFGAMFAPHQEQTASELVRVCRPGGRIALANWTSEGGAVDLYRASAGFIPPPGVRSPFEWGAPERLAELFGDYARSIRIRDQVWLLRAESPESFVEMYRTQFGPVLQTYEILNAAEREQYLAKLAEIPRRYNRSAGGGYLIAMTYLTILIDL